MSVARKKNEAIEFVRSSNWFGMLMSLSPSSYLVFSFLFYVLTHFVHLFWLLLFAWVSLTLIYASVVLFLSPFFEDHFHLTVIHSESYGHQIIDNSESACAKKTITKTMWIDHMGICGLTKEAERRRHWSENTQFVYANDEWHSCVCMCFIFCVHLILSSMNRSSHHQNHSQSQKKTTKKLDTIQMTPWRISFMHLRKIDANYCPSEEPNQYALFRLIAFDAFTPFKLVDSWLISGAIVNDPFEDIDSIEYLDDSWIFILYRIFFFFSPVVVVVL